MLHSNTIKKIFFITTHILLVVSAQAQNLQNQINFINHLTNSGHHQESLYENLKTPRKGASQQAKDSLNYLAGWSAYYLKQLENSSLYLAKVSRYSQLYAKSHLFAAYNQMHLGNYVKGNIILTDFKVQSIKEKNFILYLNAGNQLLQRNYSAFDSTLQLIPQDYFGFSKELENMRLIKENLIDRKDKSVWLSGIFSAIIPGSGKIYAGKTGQGITTFLLTTGLAMVTFENYYKNGLESFSTILFGSAFTIFYAGNIYGSMYSAKTANDDFYNLQNQKILFNLHIPLRNIFD